MDQAEKKADQVAKAELSDEQMKAQFAHSHAWKLIKDSLINKVMTMDSVSAILDNEKRKRKGIDEIMRVMYTNGRAVTIIVDWINEIETMGGIVDANFMQEINDRKKETVIVQLPD